MSVVFWDTMLFIYLIEEHPDHADQVERLRLRMLVGDDQLVTSAMTLGELLAGTSARGETEVAERYRKAVAPPFCQVLPFTVETAEHYGAIRVDRTILPADA